MHNRWLLVLLIASFSPQVCTALEARPVSSSVVLVLKLVSATHVKPTTGIVITDDGLVLVPADFVSLEGEIIVLDGGADIVKYGRPASVVHHSNPGGLAVLSVKGLKRPGIILSGKIPDVDQEFHLTAFPPAEYIAKGAPPLWAPVKFVQESPGTKFSISPATPQPYVSGPILDTCGYLAGVSLTIGQPSLKPGKIPLTILINELKRTLDSMQIRPSVATCEYQSQAEQPPVQTRQGGEVKSRNLESKEQIPTIRDPDLIKPEIYSPLIPRKRLNPFQGVSIPPQQLQSTTKPSIWRSTPIWLLLVGFVALVTLTWKLVFFFRLRRKAIMQTSSTHITAGIQPASGEPDTAPLQAGSGKGINKPRSAPLDEAELPDMNALPDGSDGVLIVDGFMDTDTRFKQFCFVNTKQINVVIGRGDVDINIQDPFISRSHARLESDGEIMTLSDLGSSSGTFIKGIPCLEGEIMYVEPEDRISLGDVQLRFNIIKREAVSP